MAMENKIRIVEYCWEILQSIKEFEESNAELAKCGYTPNFGCVDDMIGDIQSSVSSILYYLLQDCEPKDIGKLLKKGDNIND